MKRNVAMFGGPCHGKVVNIDPTAQRSYEFPWGKFEYVYSVTEFRMQNNFGEGFHSYTLVWNGIIDQLDKFGELNNYRVNDSSVGVQRKEVTPDSEFYSRYPASMENGVINITRISADAIT